LYINTSVELWDPYAMGEGTHPTQRTLYWRHMNLRRMTASWKEPGPTAVLEHGANPGLISHFTKRALLDIADIVMVDPVGTGFNRELRPGGLKPYLSVATDARAVETLIRRWLKDHRREHSPIVLLGESYGGTRVAELVRYVGDLDVRGLILISAVTDMSGTAAPGTDQQYIVDLPSMAVTATYHGRAGRPDASPGDIYEAARSFAQGPYAAALQAGVTRELVASALNRLYPEGIVRRHGNALFITDAMRLQDAVSGPLPGA
jgi:carboxypeptidase C (cathepsin A)